MRRAIVAALLLALAVPAGAAKTLVTLPADDGGTVANTWTVNELQAMVEGIFALHGRKRGIDYDVVSSCGFPTVQAQTGVTSFGTYNAVIHIIGTGALGGSTTCGGAAVRQDSLTFVAAAPTVPTLMISWGSQWGTESGTDSSLAQSTAEIQTMQARGGVHYMPGSDLAFRTNSRNGQVLIDDWESADGGVRVLIAQNTGAGWKYDHSGKIPCIDCDSTRRTSDTLRAWSRLNRHNAGAAEVVYLSAAHLANSESSPELVWLAMAHLDSISGRAVFGETPRQVDIGFQIRGEGSERTAVSMGAAPLADSAWIKAGADSMATLGIPFVVGVPPDSLGSGTVAQRISWWLRAPKAKFAPYSLTAISDSSIGGNASSTRPIDPLGRYRKRAIYGDGSGTGADTSVYALVRASYNLLAANVGVNRVDHMWMPAEDDWTPKDYDRSGLDSLVSFLSAAGVRGIVANIRERTTNPAWSRANPRGFFGHERKLTIRYGLNAGKSFPIVSTPGYNDSGSVRFHIHQGPGDGDLQFPDMDRVNMFWNGLTKGQTLIGRGSTLGKMRAIPDSADSRVHIYTVHAGDFGSGTRSDAATRPTRTAWWQIKNIVNAAKLINMKNGRGLIRFRYPEEVSP